MSVKRILLVGKGAWSTKVCNAIGAPDAGWRAEVISARAFLLMEFDSQDFTEILNKFDLLWITTTPENQILILQKLQNSQMKVILEKPIATNEREITILEEIISNSQCKIYLSQPWTFSSLWLETKKLLIPLGRNIRIQTNRGGDLLRAEFLPEADWAPHDLYLLADYAHSLGIGLNNIHLVSRESTENHVLLKYTIGSDLIFEISAGYANTRKAFWEVYSDLKLLLDLNFETYELSDCTGSNLIKHKLDSDNPIMTMLASISESDPSEDWDLVLLLYAHLVRNS